jgi:predicted RNA-binding protein YlqC (UPF0109 family)
VSDAEQPDTILDDDSLDDSLDSGNRREEQEPAAPSGRRAGDAEAIESLRGLVEYVVVNLVDNPDRAQIDVEQRGNMVALSVRLPEEELGKVIGRGGRIAKSIRTALMVAGSQHHLRVSLDIDSSGEPDWDEEAVEDAEPAPEP